MVLQQAQAFAQSSLVMSQAALAQPLYVSGVFSAPMITIFLAPAIAGVEAERRVSLPDDARLERATFAVAVSASGSTRVSSVAEVREGDSGSCVVDFGRMVTVSGLWLAGSDREVTGVARWTGVDWQFLDEDPTSFPEVATERLLVATTGNGDVVDALVDHGTVVLPARPTGLELLVDGTTVWFERQGSTPDQVVRDADGRERVQRTDWRGGDLEYGVDRTDALREALARARSVGGARQVSVRLRAATPGMLELAADIAMLHEHQIAFGPAQRSTTVDAREESVVTVVLPGPPFSAADRIREIALSLSGRFGPERVEPVEGPAVLADADLLVAVGRTLLLGIPSSLATLFGELQGVRLLLSTVRPGGDSRAAELAGRLLTADGLQGAPGLPVPGAELAPLEIPAGHTGWLTLPFPAAVPVRVVPGSPVAAWLELTASYGEVSCGLTAATEATAPVAPGARVLRRLPGGGTKGLSELRAPLQAPTVPRVALRVVGLAGRKDPLPAVRLHVPGSTAVAATDVSSDGLRVGLGLGEGQAPVGGTTSLILRLGAAGSVTLDDVVVAYRKSGTP